MFDGLNLIQTALVAFAALVYTSVVLFQERTPEEASDLGYAFLLVYLVAAGVLLARVFARARPVTREVTPTGAS